MELYDEFESAAESRDVRGLIRIIRSHPELHSHEGPDGCLTEVIFYNCPELFEQIFVAGLHPDSGPKLRHQTLLQRAVCDSNLELVRLCLKHGADVEKRNNEGETALGYAAAWGSLETVKLLVEARADVNAIEGTAENFFSTALNSACSNNPDLDRPTIRAYLQAHGAKRFGELPPTLHQNSTASFDAPHCGQRDTSTSSSSV